MADAFPMIEACMRLQNQCLPLPTSAECTPSRPDTVTGFSVAPVMSPSDHGLEGHGIFEMPQLVVER